MNKTTEQMWKGIVERIKFCVFFSCILYLCLDDMSYCRMWLGITAWSTYGGDRWVPPLHPPDSELKCRHQKTCTFTKIILYFIFLLSFLQLYTYLHQSVSSTWCCHNLSHFRLHKLFLTHCSTSSDSLPLRSGPMHYWLRPIERGTLVFRNFTSHFIGIQIFQIDFHLILYL